jgi:CBS domain-containing protein
MELWTALEEMDVDGVNQLPVMTEGRLLGVLRRADILGFVRTARQMSSA